MKKKVKNSRKKTTVLNGAVIGENLYFNKNIKFEIKEGLKFISEQGKRYRNNTPASTTGFVAEAHHISSYNVNSAFKRSFSRVIKEPDGTHGDYKIVKNGKILVEGEIKYYKTAEATEKAMRGYGNRQLVGPREQINEIKEIAKEKAAKNFLKKGINRGKVANEHLKVSENVSDAVTDGDIKSSPKSLKEMKNLTSKAKKGNLTAEEVFPISEESITKGTIAGAKTGGLIGGAVSGGMSVIKNVKEVCNNEKDLKSAVKDIIRETSKGTIDGAVKGSASTFASIGAKRVAQNIEKQLLKDVLNSSAPVIVAVSAVEVGKKFYDYKSGKINKKQFTKEVKKTVATTSAGMAGAELGATIGTMLCPGIGTVAGSVVGGVIGALGVSSFFKE